MSELLLLDHAGRRRSPATMPGGLARDQLADAIAKRVVAHGPNVSGPDVSDEDAAQPRSPPGGPLEFDGEQSIRFSGNSAVREMEPWMAGRRQLELAARAGQRHREPERSRGRSAERGVGRAHLPFGADPLMSELALKVDHQRAELQVVAVGSKIHARGREVEIDRRQPRSGGQVHARRSMKDPRVLEQPEAHEPA